MADFERVIHEALPNDEPVSVLMRRLIDAHAAAYPEGDWSAYYGLPFDAEVAFLGEHWLPVVFGTDPPAQVPVAGLWFGLFQPTRQRGETVADFYVAGSNEFEDDSDGDWAVGPGYFPEGRYANSEVLARIYRLAYGTDGGLGNIAEQYLGLGYVAFAAKHLVAEVDAGLVISNGAAVGVAVGWDSGQPLYVGYLTRDGFVVRDPHEAMAAIERRKAEFARWFRERYGKDPA